MIFMLSYRGVQFLTTVWLPPATNLVAASILRLTHSDLANL